MEPIEILALVNSLIKVSKNLYDVYAQVTGDKAIPSWNEIIANNAKLQEKIDAEK